MMITGGRVGSLEDGLDPGLNFEGIKKRLKPNRE